MCVKGFHLLAVLFGLAASGVLQVGGMRVYTSNDMEAVNGTDVRLRCTFHSSAPISTTSLTVTWSFRPLGTGKEESVLYWHTKAFLPPEGRFKKRVLWAGDILGKDASIIMREVKFIYNGTFICQVKNPPDVYGHAGEIKLRVVYKASFNELLLLALAIGGGIAGVVILLVIIVSCRRCRRNRQRQRREENEEAPRKERKDPTVCHPSRSIHLYVSETSIEIDSSDGMISDPSTKDPSSSEEDERSTDEDPGGYSD